MRRGVLANVFTVGGLTAFSRVLGLVREMMQSRILGAGMEQSAFVLAFAIPNMARKVFGEGALTAAFVPVFKGEVERGAEESARKLARAVLTTILLVLGSIVLLSVLGLSAFLEISSLRSLLSPRAGLTLRLVRILCPYMVFICGAAFGMGVLNALGRFVEGALMPTVLNVFWISALAALCFMPGLSVETRVTAVCWAILLGGVAQMAFLLRCMRKRGFGFRPLSPWRIAGDKVAADGFRRVWRNTFNAALGAGAVQVNCMLDQVLAQLASPWAAGVIGYAERLVDLPIGVVGVAFGTVLLPTFAGFFARGDLAGARESLSSSTFSLMFVMLPAAAGLFALAPDVTAVIYEGRAFDAIATVRVSRALAVYALGLGFYGLQKSIVPWFHAQGDMKTPLKVSVRMVVLNALLNVIAVAALPVEWRHVGLAASTVLCAAIGAALLVALARRRNGSLGLAAIAWPVAKITAASVAMALAIVVVRRFLPEMPRIFSLSALIAAGAATYALLALLLMRREAKAFRLPKSRRKAVEYDKI